MVNLRTKTCGSTRKKVATSNMSASSSVSSSKSSDLKSASLSHGQKPVVSPDAVNLPVVPCLSQPKVTRPSIPVSGLNINLNSSREVLPGQRVHVLPKDVKLLIGVDWAIPGGEATVLTTATDNHGTFYIVKMLRGGKQRFVRSEEIDKVHVRGKHIKRSERKTEGMKPKRRRRL
jgi:hypothetical protein